MPEQEAANPTAAVIAPLPNVPTKNKLIEMLETANIFYATIGKTILKNFQAISEFVIVGGKATLTFEECEELDIASLSLGIGESSSIY